MGKILPPKPVKLVCPILRAKSVGKNEILNLLEDNFGEIDFVSDEIPFNYTNYYEKELGRDVFRFFASFKNLILPDEIVEIKIRTNELEYSFNEKKRLINLDPGYIELSKFVLATTKNYTHRIYLGKGIYAEVTLIYKDKNFQNLPWTYPDYRSEFYKEVLMNIRKIYKKQLKEKNLL